MQPGSSLVPVVVALIVAIGGAVVLLNMDFMPDMPFGMMA